MTILGKKQMSEEDIKLNYITPVILDGWKGHVTMETKITDGRINISGNIVARSKPKFADYMLYLNDGKPIAVVEAKDNNHSVFHGLQQAKLKHEQYNAKRIQTTPKHLTLDLFNTGCWRAGTICACPPCLPKKRGRRRQSMAQSVHLDH